MAGSTATCGLRQAAAPPVPGRIREAGAVGRQIYAPARVGAPVEAQHPAPARHRRVWSGTGSARLSGAKMEATRPSARRSASRYTARTVSAASIAASERVRRPADDRHPATASGDAQTVMSPRRASARSYAAQSRTA